MSNFQEVFKGMLHIINDPTTSVRHHSVSYKLDKRNNGTDKCAFTLIYLLDGIETDYIVHDNYEYDEEYTYEFVENLFWKRVVTHLMFFYKNDKKQSFYERS